MQYVTNCGVIVEAESLEEAQDILRLWKWGKTLDYINAVVTEGLRLLREGRRR